MAVRFMSWSTKEPFKASPPSICASTRPVKEPSQMVPCNLSTTTHCGEMSTSPFVLPRSSVVPRIL